MFQLSKGSQLLRTPLSLSLSLLLLPPSKNQGKIQFYHYYHYFDSEFNRSLSFLLFSLFQAKNSSFRSFMRKEQNRSSLCVYVKKIVRDYST